MKRARRNLALALVTGYTAFSSVGHATPSWTGNGSTDNSGSWNTGANWGGSVPGTADVPALNNVTTGTRTVTVDVTPATATKGITFVQTTASAVNTLAISSGAVLTLSNGGNAFGTNTNAGSSISSVVANIDGTLAFTTTNTAAQTLANTINLGNGGTIQYSSLSNPTINIAGALTANPGNSNAASITTLGTASSTFAFNLLSGSSLNVSTGTLNISAPTTNAGVSIACTIASGGLANIANGATLALVTAGGTGNKSVSFSNAGSLTQAGTITLRSQGGSSVAPTFTNTGTWTISGANAQVIQKSGISAKNLTITNDIGGTLTGSGTLAVSNENALPFITLTNNGTIDPGAGGIGTLTVSNVKVGFGATQGTLRIDAESAVAGHYDVLAVAAGSTTGTGALDLSGSNDVLDLHLLNGFSPTSSFTLTGFATYASETGSFESILVNGAALPGGWSAVANFGATSANLVVTVTPEPASLSMAAILGLASLQRPRRRKAKMLSA